MRQSCNTPYSDPFLFINGAVAEEEIIKRRYCDDSYLL